MEIVAIVLLLLFPLVLIVVGCLVCNYKEDK